MLFTYLRAYPAWRRNTKQIQKAYKEIGAEVERFFTDYEKSMAPQPFFVPPASLLGRVGYGRNL